MDINFVQDNYSRSSFGVLRGLHFQLPPYEQGKLVWVTSGEIFDVAVDLRKNSPTFLNYVSVILNEQNKQQLWIPEGFAHGFTVLSKHADFKYKVSNYYNPGAERTIIWNDINLNIDWPDITKIISDKDKNGVQSKDLIKIL